MVACARLYFADRNDRTSLEDILFAQCCLFLTVRIHDDLIDGQSRESWLILAGDDLLIEAQEQLARHIEDAAYWSLFRRAVRKTLHGIAEVDRLQTQPSGMPASARRLYADVAAILSVGVGAVFARTGRLAEYPMFERLFADLAIASQVLDDLEDVEEDAQRGRLNVAATIASVHAGWLRAAVGRVSVERYSHAGWCSMARQPQSSTSLGFTRDVLRARPGS